MRLPIFRADDTRSLSTRLRRLLVQTQALAGLPAPVRAFYLRALWSAFRHRDQYSFDVVTRPDDLRVILNLADDAVAVVELGTATAWTTIALALSGPAERRVTSFDPVIHPQRQRYLRLAGPAVSSRITFVQAMGRTGPRGRESVDFLFVDGSHERQDTILTFKRWQEAIRAGGRIAFHDYGDPAYPGVTEAIEELGLSGRQLARVFVWSRPAG